MQLYFSHLFDYVFCISLISINILWECCFIKQVLGKIMWKYCSRENIYILLLRSINQHQGPGREHLNWLRPSLFYCYYYCGEKCFIIYKLINKTYLSKTVITHVWKEIVFTKVSFYYLTYAIAVGGVMQNSRIVVKCVGEIGLCIADLTKGTKGSSNWFF